MSANIFFKASVFVIILTFISCSSDDTDTAPVEIIISVATEDFSTTMDEGPENGQIIGVVQGSTNEGSVRFSIAEQSPAGAFAVDSVTGELTVADAAVFRFKYNPEITGTVKVRNGDVFENANVSIHLNKNSNEKVYEGNIILYTQEEVNNFGANRYTHISGSLVIGTLEFAYSDSEILTLTPLSSLQNITGNLTICFNGLLEGLNGLENLETIGNQLIFWRNPSLNNIAAFAKLTVIKGDLVIDTNESLKNLNGLDNLVEVRKNLLIYSNENLTDISSLSNLAHLGLDLKIEDNKKLEIINLNSLTSVPRDLIIRECFKLTNLNGASNITSIGGNLSIHSNLELSDFCGLSNLLIGGYFEGTYKVYQNAYNPTQQDVIDGNCAI